ncbi:MAG: nitronate monooxygenase [Burkholderiales bacterium]|nr:nitronate monooxygenase [Burkholderiales bacterium]
MIRTAFCEALGVEHPVALGGMGSIFAPPLVAAVSEAGGLGALGCHGLGVEQIRSSAREISERTRKPYGLNFLLFLIDEKCFEAALAARPPVIAFAWPRGDQALEPYIERAHGAGAKVTFMVSDVAGARRAAEAGADVIVAQGSEGGGHVGWMGSIALTPIVVDAVAPLPVLSAGGFADGRGLAAALALGASGVLFGTRFLASEESPLHRNFKQAIVASDGHDTLLTEIPDIAANLVWPGAMSRSRRNRFVERWAGREWALRRHQAEALAGVQAARLAGDLDEAPLSFGQDAGLIREVLPAAQIVRRVVADAERILTNRLPGLIR